MCNVLTQKHQYVTWKHRTAFAATAAAGMVKLEILDSAGMGGMDWLSLLHDDTNHYWFPFKYVSNRSVSSDYYCCLITKKKVFLASFYKNETTHVSALRARFTLVGQGSHSQTQSPSDCLLYWHFLQTRCHCVLALAECPPLILMIPSKQLILNSHLNHCWKYDRRFRHC